jgi:hypothetical protein
LLVLALHDGATIAQRQNQVAEGLVENECMGLQGSANGIAWSSSAIRESDGPHRYVRSPAAESFRLFTGRTLDTQQLRATFDAAAAEREKLVSE